MNIPNTPATCYGFPCLYCDGTGKEDAPDDDNEGEDCLWCGGTGETPDDDGSIEASEYDDDSNEDLDLPDLDLPAGA